MTVDIPPLTSPLVHIADIDRVVIIVTRALSKTIREPSPIPACPTTQDNLRKSITPHMFRRHLT